MTVLSNFHFWKYLVCPLTLPFDLHESSCFGLRGQKLIRLSGSISALLFICEILVKGLD